MRGKRNTRTTTVLQGPSTASGVAVLAALGVLALLAHVLIPVVPAAVFAMCFGLMAPLGAGYSARRARPPALPLLLAGLLLASARLPHVAPLAIEVAISLALVLGLGLGDRRLVVRMLQFVPAALLGYWLGNGLGEPRQEILAQLSHWLLFAGLVGGGYRLGALLRPTLRRAKGLRTNHGT
ncbi:MAG: hypothetical protein IPP14_08485 [Planctomycetes bacterium]|nr:hypothetical protein [Planctomycetota bacterium]